MNLGKFKIDVVDTGIFRLDGGAMFGVIPKAIWSKAYDKGDIHNRLPFAVRLLLIRWDDKIILVDTGNGTKLDGKLVDRYGIDINKSDLNNALKPFGLTKSEITHVILTHLHFDHAGGATDKINNKIIPAFPNAKYYIQKEHFQWANNPSEKDRASFFLENYMPLMQAGVLELIDGEYELFDGITLLPLYGHTKAMQLVKVTDNNKSLLFMADLCPSSAHIPIPYVMGYDNYPMTVIEEKKRILAKAVKKDWIIVYEHDAFIQASTINFSEKGYKAANEIVITDFDKLETKK